MGLQQQSSGLLFYFVLSLLTKRRKAKNKTYLRKGWKNIMFVFGWQHIDQTTEAIKAHNVYFYLQSWKFFMSTEEKKSTTSVEYIKL